MYQWLTVRARPRASSATSEDASTSLAYLYPSERPQITKKRASYLRPLRLLDYGGAGMCHGLFQRTSGTTRLPDILTTRTAPHIFSVATVLFQQTGTGPDSVVELKARH